MVALAEADVGQRVHFRRICCYLAWHPLNMLGSSLHGKELKPVCFCPALPKALCVMASIKRASFITFAHGFGPSVTIGISFEGLQLSVYVNVGGGGGKPHKLAFQIDSGLCPCIVPGAHLVLSLEKVDTSTYGRVVVCIMPLRPVFSSRFRQT
jgi:hypothetical protein